MLIKTTMGFATTVEKGIVEMATVTEEETEMETEMEIAAGKGKDAGDNL
jgi:hypothetical protein